MKWYLMVLNKYVQFDGRSRRKEFWMFFLIHLVISIGLNVIAGIIDFAFLGTIYSIAVFLPYIAVSIRRMHDVGKSGWFILIPIYNIILYATEGDKGPNKYGEDPKDETISDSDVLDSDLIKG